MILRLALLLLLAGCGASPLGLLAGGPKVAANGQAAGTAAQTIGKSEQREARIDHVTAERITQTADTTKVRADQVQTVVVQEYPAWLILAFAVALFLDSPLRWPEQIAKAVRGKRTR